MLGLFIRLIAIALVGYVVWRVWRMMCPRYTFQIVIGKQGIEHYKGLPKAHESSVLEFFDKHRSFDGNVSICAMRQPDGYLRLVFKEQVDPDTRQQIRNFLVTVTRAWENMDLKVTTVKMWSSREKLPSTHCRRMARQKVRRLSRTH